MIAYLTGTVEHLSETHAVLLTPGGVGYEIACPTSVLARLPKLGEQASLHIHTNVQEKAIDLYGFTTRDDLDLFRTLISIDKLGPKKAIAILAKFDADHLREITFREDVDTLATVPGIGPKSARQILWHLKDKVEGLMKVRAHSASAKAAPAAPGAQSQYFDTLAGLKNLGYAEEEIRPLLKEIFEEEPDIDAGSAIRQALKRIAAARS